MKPNILIPPGLILAVTGIGASDIISATVGGARHGLVLLWALLLGAFLKLVLTEGLARWQLATGLTALEGWAAHLPRWVLWLFAVYLVLWSIAVSGALVSGCGLAVENLTHGVIPRQVGAAAHAVVVFFFVFYARSAAFARLMKPLIGVMIISILSCAVLTFRHPLDALSGFIPIIPTGGVATVFSLIGGIGGSLTLLGYNYLMREDGLVDPENLRRVRKDLLLAYGFTALIGVCVMLVAHWAFFIPGIPITDATAVSRMADQLGNILGPAGFYIYSLGFWAAVVASLVGVWELVPRIFADCWGLLRRLPQKQIEESLEPTSVPVRVGLGFMALVSVPFIFLNKPIAIVIAFTILGSLMVPLLAGTQLYMNNRIPWSAPIPHNGPLSNITLWVALILFSVIGGQEVWELLSGK